MNGTSVTKATSQLLNTLYPTKIVNDFHQYLEDEEYDSEVLKDDLKDEEPFFVEYIISENPSTFNNQTQKRELIINVKTLLNNNNNNNNNKRDSQDNNNNERKENDEKYIQWACKHCTFINTSNANICSVCNNHLLTHHDNDNDNDNDKWYCIYIQLKDNYLNQDQCNQYYATIIDIIKKKQFEMDDVLDDLNGFSEINNDSIIAECIVDKLGWNQNDINTIRLITCLKHALCKKNKKNQKNQKNEKNNFDDEHLNEWKMRIATIIGLRDDDKYKYNTKLAKYDLFAKALNVFNDDELCCLFRLYIRQQMIKSQQELENTIDMNVIIKFIKYRFPEKSQKFDDEDIHKIFKIGFCNKFIGHNSILNKLNTKYHILINIQNIQIWMIAIVMKINQYFRKYRSCHSIFCIRFLPQLNNDNNNDNDNDNDNADDNFLYRKIEKAFKMLDEKEKEKEILSDYCWTFIIDLSLNETAEIYFESIELYDDEIICGQEYNDSYAKNQLYHLKKLDYLICKQNDNTRIALQISFHKMENDCVSWLTHSSGHIPFFENDIIYFVPKLFKKCDNAIKSDEWQQIIDNNKIMDIKSMDRKYCELEQSYINFMKL